MLYYLFKYLEQLDFPGARMFGYVSFRSLMAIILSLLISAIFGEYFIKLLKKKQITETQRDASIDPFNVNKVGVPTMGGIIIIVAVLIPCLLLGKLNNIYMILMLITTVWLGSLGFADDYIKVFRKDKEGLHGKFKIIGQVGLGLIVGLTLYLSPNVVIRENVEIQKDGHVVDVVHKSQDEKSTKTTIPFFKKQQPGLCRLCRISGRTCANSRLDCLCAGNNLCGNCGFKRCQPERWNGWHGGRKLSHHRSNPRNTSICIQSYRVCQLPEYHVYSGE